MKRGWHKDAYTHTHTHTRTHARTDIMFGWFVETWVWNKLRWSSARFVVKNPGQIDVIILGKTGMFFRELRGRMKGLGARQRR